MIELYVYSTNMSGAKMNVNLFTQKDYQKKPPLGPRKNKANSKPISFNCMSSLQRTGATKSLAGYTLRRSSGHQ